MSSTEIAYTVDIPAKMKADEFQNPDFFTKVEELVKSAIKEAGEFDPSNEDDRARAKSLALKISKTKTALEEKGKAITADWRAKIDGVNKTRNRFVSLLDGLRDEVRGPAIEFEKKLKAQEDEYKSRIADIRSLGEVAIDANSASIKQRLSSLDAIVVDDTWGEYQTAATDAKASSIVALNKALTITEEREAQAAELEQLKRQQAANAATPDDEHPIEKAVEATKAYLPPTASNGQKIAQMRKARKYLTATMHIDVALASSILTAIANNQVPYIRFQDEV